MKKHSVKVLSVLLCILMLVPCLLTGCREEDGTSEGTGTTPQGYTGEPGGGDKPEPSTLIVYPEFDARIERDYMYTVSVTQGEKTATLPVYNHAVVSNCTRNPLDTSSDENRRFSTFAFDATGGGVRVDIRVNRDFESYSVMPSAKKFRSEFHKGVISVYLDKPDYFAIRLNNMDSTVLAVFADEPESEVPQKGANNIIVDGWKDVDGGVLELQKQGTTVYVKPGAVLNARIKVSADDCKIIGRGVILDPCGDIYNYDEKEIAQGGMLWIRNANNTVVDGVHLLNSHGFNVFVQGVWGRTYSKNNRVTNTKILSSALGSDGISFNYYNKDSWAEHCFVYCGDNALVYEDGAHYKDILLGTTCNAMYPQTGIRNSSLEDIYVFRADDNIISAQMDEGDRETPIDNSTITNLYLQDVTYTHSFLFILNIKTTVVSSNGGFTIKNVYLPGIDGFKSRFYQNAVQGNYEVNLINVSIDGTTVPSITLNHNTGNYDGYVYPDKKWGWIGYPDSHKFNYSTTTDFNPNIQKHIAKINYMNELNVLIGMWQVYYENPVIREGNEILLPLKQTQYELRTDKSADVVERNGVQYVSVSALVSSGMVKEVKTDGNSLILTPNYSGENLILPDSGILSQFAQSNPPHMEIVAEKKGDSVQLHLTANEAQTGGFGLYCLLNEAIKKYGTGTYRLMFKAKSDKEIKLTAGIGYGMGSTARNEITVTAGTDWVDGTLDFRISSADQKQLQIYMKIVCDWAKDAQFDLTDICLTKIS